MPVARTCFHIRQEQLTNEFKSVFAKTLLIGTLHQEADTTCPAAKLRGLPDVWKSIFEFARPLDNEGDFYYKMAIVMCMGTEHVHVEALENNDSNSSGRTGTREQQQHFGFLSNQTIGGASWVLTKKFLRQYAWSKNDDGSYLQEGQLRKLWRDFVLEHYCGSPTGRCKGACAVLPGDTVYWRRTSYGYPQSYKYEPATQEDLEERGYLQVGPGGLLVAQAKIARDDPSQVATDDDDE